MVLYGPCLLRQFLLHIYFSQGPSSNVVSWLTLSGDVHMFGFRRLAAMVKPVFLCTSCDGRNGCAGLFASIVVYGIIYFFSKS